MVPVCVTVTVNVTSSIPLPFPLFLVGVVAGEIPLCFGAAGGIYPAQGENTAGGGEGHVGDLVVVGWAVPPERAARHIGEIGSESPTCSEKWVRGEFDFRFRCRF